MARGKNEVWLPALEPENWDQKGGSLSAETYDLAGQRKAIEQGGNRVAVLKPRERLVYFRVSEDEFRQFVSVCEQAGARSVSDLARSAVQRLIAEGNRQREDEELTNKMYRLERLIAQVTEQLHLLNQPPCEVLNGFAEGAGSHSSAAHSSESSGQEGE